MMIYGQNLQRYVLTQLTNTMLKEVGRGGFGTVFRGELNGQKYAMKKFHSGNRENFIHERTFAQLENPHLVTAVGCSTEYSKEDFLIFPLSEDGSLKDCKFISNNIKLVLVLRMLI